jgi:hypothetical protein
MSFGFAVYCLQWHGLWNGLLKPWARSRGLVAPSGKGVRRGWES